MGNSSTIQFPERPQRIVKSAGEAGRILSFDVNSAYARDRSTVGPWYPLFVARNTDLARLLKLGVGASVWLYGCLASPVREGIEGQTRCRSVRNSAYLEENWHGCEGS
jgi:hypothetical protein